MLLFHRFVTEFFQLLILIISDVRFHKTLQIVYLTLQTEVFYKCTQSCFINSFFFHIKQITFKISLCKCTLGIMSFSATLDSYLVCFNIKKV